MDSVLMIQARLASTRLPYKVLAPFCGVPMLAYQIRRLRTCGHRLMTLVPTTDLPVMTAALRGHLCGLRGIPGNSEDVLGRFARVAEDSLAPGTLIVRVCGDCPLLCPCLLTALVIEWNATPGLAYLGMGMGWPDGLADYDLFTREALLVADACATAASDREHVVPFFWRDPERFPQTVFEAPDWVKTQSWPKLSVDTPEDLAYVEQVAQATRRAAGENFMWPNVLQTLQADASLWRPPEAMNPAYVEQVAWERGRSDLTWDAVRGLTEGTE